jgi:hypothetical protein
MGKRRTIACLLIETNFGNEEIITERMVSDSPVNIAWYNSIAAMEGSTW